MQLALSVYAIGALLMASYIYVQALHVMPDEPPSLELAAAIAGLALCWPLVLFVSLYEIVSAE